MTDLNAGLLHNPQSLRLNKKKSGPKNSCIWLFKLETGVATIVYLDIILMILMFMTTNYQSKKALDLDK